MLKIVKLKQLLLDNWRPLALYGGMFALLGVLVYWRLGTLLPGYSADEVATYHAGSQIDNLLHNPLYAPFLLLERALFVLHPDSLLVTRLVAAAGGMATLALFCWLVRQWHGRRAAIIATLLFGTSAWFLHVSRLGTPEIMLFGALALVACGYWFKHSQSWMALLSCFILSAALLYVPGMLWFIVIGLVWQWRTVDAVFKRHLLTVSGGTVLLLVALIPLGWGLYQQQSLIMPWLGLPSTWPMPWDVAKNILLVPYHLAISNSADPKLWLGTAPVLDVASLTLFVLGGVRYLRSIRSLRTPILLSVLAVGIGMIALGTGTLSLIIPFIYIGIAGGVGYLLDQWLRVFPRNPIARGIGLLFVSGVLVLAIAFHTRHYFIGFPQADATHQVYIFAKP